METSIIVSGFGGQGALFAGQLLAYAGMDLDRAVTWIPSYGPEMRGGTAHCTVIISDTPIGAPTVSQPDIALVLNQPSYEKYLPLVVAGGLLVFNSTLVAPPPTRDDIQLLAIEANDIAEEMGSLKMANVVLVGAMLAARPVVPLETASAALSAHLLRKKKQLLEGNLKALQAGFDRAQVAVS